MSGERCESRCKTDSVRLNSTVVGSPFDIQLSTIALTETGTSKHPEKLRQRCGAYPSESPRRVRQLLPCQQNRKALKRIFPTPLGYCGLHRARSHLLHGLLQAIERVGSSNRDVVGR